MLSNTTHTLEKFNALQIFERISDAFFALDNDFNYVYLNKAAIALHQVSEETLLGKNIWQLYPELVGGEFYKALHKSKETQETQQNEFYHSHTEKWYIDSIYPDENGLSIYYSDITEQKKAKSIVEKSEEALKLSIERFEYITKATKDVIWDWDIENDILKGDEKYCKLFDIGLGETIDFSTFQTYIHPSDRDRINKNFSNAVKNKDVLLTEEFTLIKKDGSEKVISDRAYIFYNNNGMACRMIGAMQDITELKAIEKILIDEKEVSDSIINSLPGVFYLFNRKEKFLRWNKNLEIVTGYTSAEIEVMNPLDFVHKEEQKSLQEKIGNVFLHGSDTIETNMYTKDERLIPFYFSGKLVKYQNEECLVGIGIDVSEKVAAEDKLKKSQQEYRDLATQIENIREVERTNIAREIHDELGQQLTGLKMDISWINKKVKSDDEAVIEKIKDIVELIDKTVITVRRISTELRPSILDDLGLISAMDWQSEEFEKRAEIKSFFKANVTHVNLDPDVATNIFRIFQESLTNISRHAKATEVNTSLIVENDLLTFTVKDNGIGFNQHDIIHKKTLGLLGMKERVLLINGKYKINSDSNTGTTIIISVPLKTTNKSII